MWSDLISYVDLMALRFLLIFPLTKRQRQIGVLESCYWALCRPLKHHYHHLPLFKECAEGITSVMRPTWISTQYSLVGHAHAHALAFTCTLIHDVLDFYKAIHIWLTWFFFKLGCLLMKKNHLITSLMLWMLCCLTDSRSSVQFWAWATLWVLNTSYQLVEANTAPRPHCTGHILLMLAWSIQTYPHCPETWMQVLQYQILS